MARVFVYDGREFPDPDPALSVDDVKASFTQFFPELANAEVKQSTRGEGANKVDVYQLVKRVGTKGNEKPD